MSGNAVSAPAGADSVAVTATSCAVADSVSSVGLTESVSVGPVSVRATAPSLFPEGGDGAAMQAAPVPPVGHARHDSASAGRCRPGGQASQLRALRTESACGGHAAQPSSVSRAAAPQRQPAPARLLWPAGQAMHDGSAAGRSVSDGHGSQSVFAAFGRWFGGHSRQTPPASYSTAPAQSGGSTRHTAVAAEVKPASFVAKTVSRCAPGAASAGGESSISRRGLVPGPPSQVAGASHAGGASAVAMSCTRSSGPPRVWIASVAVWPGRTATGSPNRIAGASSPNAPGAQNAASAYASSARRPLLSCAWPMATPSLGPWLTHNVRSSRLKRNRLHGRDSGSVLRRSEAHGWHLTISGYSSGPRGSAMTSVTVRDLQGRTAAIRRRRAAAAVSDIQREAKRSGRDRLTSAQIDAEIQAVRKARRDP